ncbi:MAG: aldo/keto reductase [Candidatus Obscuribacterales bacterium]|nr:aldo/keto reductase [Candidatus Obscuribacterales bacterium]
MERRILGKTGLAVSVLGFGAAEIGFGVEREKAERLLLQALENGLNLIDTAECYNNSEDFIGSSLAARRKEVYLMTKCGHKDHWELDAWKPKELKRSIEHSLKKLRTDYVDVLQLHGCNERLLRDGAVIEVLQKAKADGKARFIGYSGDEQAAAYAVACGAFDTLQTTLNFADQKPLDALIPAAQEKNMGLIAKRPVANAVWRRKHIPPQVDKSLSARLKRIDSLWVRLKIARLKQKLLKLGPINNFWDYGPRIKELNFDFIESDPEESLSTALRFTLAAPGVHCAIVGTTNPQHWIQNLHAVMKGPISEAEFAAIRKHWLEKRDPQWKTMG